VAACAFCGRDNDTAARFCADCGQRLSASVAVVPERARPAEPSAVATLPVMPATPRPVGPQLALLSLEGRVEERFPIAGGDGIVGRTGGSIRLGDDLYLSPVHAQFTLRDGVVWVRDLGSRNGTWVFLDGPHRLSDGDVLLVGSQLLRFRRLGYPAPTPAEANGTRRLGSATPPADIAVMEQRRADGSVRDTFHLSPGRTVSLGRERGDWLFPYDPTMSGAHAEIRSEDADFVVRDTASRNGVAVAVRGERALTPGQRVLLGDRTLRVDYP
jgi:pSer/pThr/pTyr-binding forkhead associated (FHA) protein